MTSSQASSAYLRRSKMCANGYRRMARQIKGEAVTL